MRELLTLARQLRPTALDDLGLTAAIGGQVEQIARPGLETALDAEGDFSDLDDDVQLVIYRVAQEALSNAARHSDAERIAVSLRRAGDGASSSRSPMTAAASPSGSPSAGSGSPGCASGRCSSAPS